MLSLLLRGEFCLRQLENGHTENEQKCPSVHTLTAVHGAVLEDLVFLRKIVGERREAEWQSAHKGSFG